MDCPSGGSIQKREEIKQLLREGHTKDEIKKLFVKKYGATVLISPPFSGFNLLVWTLPFVGIAAAGYFIYRYIKDREERMANAPKVSKKRTEEDEIEDELLRASIEEEMKKYR
ncbi:cytochrome c-type biogenesis protein [Desulfuribacillus stibiiarsenatis]|uniref:cytochrome c-type biogenesis protein n=1 Tax=Desulfuribacillus stibiiarsenatis TaxID=1390249 RepID=UPI0009F1D9DD